jgi:hypothetical protein
VILPYVKQSLEYNTVLFPKPQNAFYDIIKIIITSSLLILSTFVQGIKELREPEKNVENIQKRKIIPLLLLVTLTVPFVYAILFESEMNIITQTILNLAAMDEDFDDIPPGSDPPGWEESTGNWTTVDDGGNIVYYQSNDDNKEALTISTTGNTSWTDYTFTVDVKFDEGPANKPDRGALLVYRYTGGNEYYFLAMREARDELEVYKHGTAGAGHLVGTASCTLVQDTWYSVNITIRSNIVWISVDSTPYFTNLDMLGTQSYKVMFDNIHVDLK